MFKDYSYEEVAAEEKREECTRISKHERLKKASELRLLGPVNVKASSKPSARRET